MLLDRIQQDCYNNLHVDLPWYSQPYKLGASKLNAPTLGCNQPRARPHSVEPHSVLQPSVWTCWFYRTTESTALGSLYQRSLISPQQRQYDMGSGEGRWPPDWLQHTCLAPILLLTCVIGGGRCPEPARRLAKGSNYRRKPPVKQAWCSDLCQRNGISKCFISRQQQRQIGGSAEVLKSARPYRRWQH